MPRTHAQPAAHTITSSKTALNSTEGYMHSQNSIPVAPTKPCQPKGVEWTALHKALLIVQQEHMAFGVLCQRHTRKRIQNWLLHVEIERSLPFGEFPSAESLNGSLAKIEIPTYVHRGLVQGKLQLEWSELGGGCYIQTYPSEPLYGMIPRDMQTTDVSQAWLASRGYRGGAGSPPPSSTSQGQGEDGDEQAPPDQEAAHTDGNIHASPTSIPRNDAYASEQRPKMIRSDSVLAIEGLDRPASRMDISQHQIPEVPTTTVQRVELPDNQDPAGSNKPWKMQAVTQLQGEDEAIRQAARDVVARHFAAIEEQRLRLGVLRIINAATRARAAVVAPSRTAGLRAEWGLSVKKAAFRRRNTI